MLRVKEDDGKARIEREVHKTIWILLNHRLSDSGVGGRAIR